MTHSGSEHTSSETSAPTTALETNQKSDFTTVEQVEQEE